MPFEVSDIIDECHFLSFPPALGKYIRCQHLLRKKYSFRISWMQTCKNPFSSSKIHKLLKQLLFVLFLAVFLFLVD